MTKILVAGIGGVGGYFGGMLARAFADNQDVEISFLARGEHLHEIRKNGLTVQEDDASFVARPKQVSDNPSQLGRMDYIILCTKSYDLLPLLTQLRFCIDDQTVILPLMNGVDSDASIRNHFPGNVLAEGCVHISARYIAPGHIAKTGATAKLFFGLPHAEHALLKALEDILLLAGIDATCTTDISRIIWEKFIFISAVATATSFFDNPIGFIIEDDLRRADIYRLFGEAAALAEKTGIILPDDLPAVLMKRLEGIPYESTSSMHSDFKAKKERTELESLTGFVVREGARHSIPTPVFARMYDTLRSR